MGWRSASDDGSQQVSPTSRTCRRGNDLVTIMRYEIYLRFFFSPLQASSDILSIGLDILDQVFTVD